MPAGKRPAGRLPRFPAQEPVRTAAASLHVPAAPGAATPRQGVPFAVPAATALPGTLALGNALRPLKRRVPSPTARVLDETATAEHKASDGVWMPVERPAPARWLDLALVIDQSPSMAVWSRTVEELRRLAERHGAFRDVRIWLLDTGAADGAAVLYAGTDSATSRARRSTPRELADPGGRRLIAVVSDCVGPAWSSGAVSAMLAGWGRTGPVAVISMLPQRLWRHTGVDTEPVTLRAPGPGAPNVKLEAQSERARAERELAALLASLPDSQAADALRRELAVPAGRGAVPVPVVGLHRQWVAPWARLIAGAGGQPVPSAVLWADEQAPRQAPTPPGPPPAAAEPSPAAPAELVGRFRALVSPAAFQLACYLSAVPVTLPIGRLVQQAMLPGSAQAHLAEVLLGGILQQVTPARPGLSPDQVGYDFADGVRELLQEALPGTDTLQVIRVVGDFIGARAGRTGTLPSLLVAPDGTAAASEEERAFAVVTARTLRRLGGAQAELASRLERAAGAAQPEAAQADPSPVYAVAATVQNGHLIAASGHGNGMVRVRDLLTDKQLVEVGPSMVEGEDEGDVDPDALAPVFAVASAELDDESLIVFSRGNTEIGVAYLTITPDGHSVRVGPLPLPRPAAVVHDDDEGYDDWDGTDYDDDNEVTALAVGVVAGRHVVAAGFVDGTIAVRDLESGGPLFSSFRGHDDAVSALVVGEWQGLPTLLSGGLDLQVQGWDPVTGERRFGILPGTPSGVNAVAVTSHHGQPLAIAAGDRRIAVWELDTGALVYQLTSPSEVYAVAVASLADGQQVIVTGGEDGVIRLWDLDSGRLEASEYADHAGPVNALATGTLDGRPFVVSGGGDGAVRAWELPHGLDDGAAAVAVPPELADAAVAMFSLMLRNVAGGSNVITDPLGVAGAALPGCIIASPSSPATDSSQTQNYVYNWTRDAAIVAMELAAADLQDKRPLADYVRFALTCQDSPGAGVDRGCYLIDGRPRAWSDAADGPALQTLAILRLYGQLDDRTRRAARTVMGRNLDFLEQAYQGSTTDIWEERRGYSFFTRSVQLRCLREVAVNRAGLPVPRWGPGAVSWLENALEDHWNGKYYESLLPSAPPQSSGAPYDPSIDVVMAAVYGAADPADTRVLATAGLLRDQWTNVESKFVFPINYDDRERDIGPLLGRYPGDVFSGGEQTGGHPWAVSTACFAEFCYLLADRVVGRSRVPLDDWSASFFRQVGVAGSGTSPADAATALREAGDKMLRAVFYHSDDYHLSEMFDDRTGFLRGAKDLSWSFAAFLSAMRARARIRRHRPAGAPGGGSPAAGRSAPG